MEINVKGSGSVKSCKVEGVEGSTTIGDLKKRVADESGLPVEQQRLFLKGKLLKDEDTLDVAKVTDKATLFLVKGASSSGSSATAASTETTEPKKVDEAPALTVPCAGGCGFFGTEATDNMCSKCYAKKNKKAEEKTKEKEERAKKEQEEAEKKASEEAKTSEDGEGDREKEKRPVQEDKTKCWMCSKKVGLTGFLCRCGYVFCSKHRYAEEHSCDFDHQGFGRDILSKNNPNVAVDEKKLLDGA